MEFDFISHTFGPGQTVNAVLYKYNGFNINPALMTNLHNVFMARNPTANPPKLGQTVLIPVAHVDETI